MTAFGGRSDEKKDVCLGNDVFVFVCDGRQFGFDGTCSRADDLSGVDGRLVFVLPASKKHNRLGL